MMRVFLIAGSASASVAAPVVMLAAPSADDSKDDAEIENVGEFGDHERPWADDVLDEQYQAQDDQEPERRGLVQSQERISELLDREELPLPAARVSSMAAVTEVLATISEERTALAEEWQALEDQKAEIALANRRALEEIERLEDLRTEVSALIDELEVKEDENLQRVIAVVSNMTSRNAARLLEQNEPQFVVQVLDQVGERNAADILSRMRTDKANELMALMAERGRPDDQRAF